MIKMDKVNIDISSINDQLYELSQKDFPLFMTLCEFISDSLSEELDRLYDHDNIDSICELLDEEFIMNADL